MSDRTITLRSAISLRLHYVIARHGSKQRNWWEFHRTEVPSEVCNTNFHELIKSHRMDERWSFAFFHEATGGQYDYLKVRYLHFLSGQSLFTCGSHSCILTFELRSRGKVCHFSENGGNRNQKAHLSCPLNTFNVCVCLKYFLDNPEVAHKLFPRALDSLRTAVDIQDSSDEEANYVEPAPLYDDSWELRAEESTQLGFVTDADFVNNFGHQSALKSID